MKTRLMIGSALALIVLGILALAYLFLSGARPEDTAPDAPSGGNPFGFPSGSISGEAGQTRTLDSAGGTVTVPEFTEGKEAVALSSETGDLQYDLTPYPEFVPGTPYPAHAFDVQFNGLDSTFVVTLNEEPLGAARLKAEEFLRATLRLSDAQICSLNITVGVPYSVNESLSAYQDLGLSFCPEAYPLP